MTEPSATPVEARCARCGEAASGRFCSNCGAPVHDVSCNACGRPLDAGARFCNNCGVPAGGAGAPARQSRPDLAKLVAGAAVLALVAFVAGEGVARRSSASDAPLLQQGIGAPSGGMPSAPDISNMSPEERASRLFNRVMAYSEQGKTDSARFFAPMAIQAYQMIGPLDAHARYDIGTISAVVGEGGMARVEADSILAAQPKNLLGLVLAIRAASMAGDMDAAARFQRRLIDAAPAERTRGVKEYDEHRHDIDEALTKAGVSR
jgi:hypothetical protein